MSDNDLIQRGDAREILEDGGFLGRSLERLSAIPAVQPTVSPDVAALVEALFIARVHVANNAQGWSVGRGAARDDLAIVDAALARVKGVM